MTGDGADEVDGVEDDAGLAVVHHRDTIDITTLAIRRRRRQHANQLRRKWPHLFFPPGRQFTGSIVFLSQARRQVARAGVITLNHYIIVAPEVTRIAAAT